MNKVECANPLPGKASTRIDKWKYDKVSAAILSIVPQEGDGFLFKELAESVARVLGADTMASIGSSGWYTTTVKLDLEAKGSIYRVPKSAPQRLLKR